MWKNPWVTSGPKYTPPPLNLLEWQSLIGLGSAKTVGKLVAHLKTQTYHSSRFLLLIQASSVVPITKNADFPITDPIKIQLEISAKSSHDYTMNSQYSIFFIVKLRLKGQTLMTIFSSYMNVSKISV